MRLGPDVFFDHDEDFDKGELDDSEIWLRIPNEGSGAGYQDMIDFMVDEVDDRRLAQRLDRALSGRGPFRRFRDALWDEEELFTEWHAFSDDRHLGRARDWLAEEGYAARPRRRSAGH